MRSISIRSLALIAFVVFLCAGCIHATEPDAGRMARDTNALAGTVLPLLEQLHVSEWRDQDWCRDFAYEDGHFLTSDEPDTCNPLGDPTASFTEGATSAFDQVGSALDASGVSVLEVERFPSVPARIVFDLRAGLYDRFSYVFEPGYAPPENIPNEWVATPIDSNWYFVWEDWN